MKRVSGLAGMLRATGAGMLALVCAAAAIPGVQAQEPRIGIELNASDDVENACRVSFLVENAMGEEISALVFEVAVIGRDSGVKALIRLDFGRLPESKKRVRQFDIAGQTCAGISRVLLNDVAECTGDGLTPDTCLDALAVSTRGAIAFDM